MLLLVRQLINQYNCTLRQSLLEVYTPALQETSRLAGMMVRQALVLNKAKQHMGNIGGAGGSGGSRSSSSSEDQFFPWR